MSGLVLKETSSLGSTSPLYHQYENTMSDPFDPSKMKTEHDEIAPEPSMLGEVQSHPGMAHDDVFGEMSEGGPNYRDVCPVYTGDLYRRLY